MIGLLKESFLYWIFLYKKNSTTKRELKQVAICYEKYNKSV